MSSGWQILAPEKIVTFDDIISQIQATTDGDMATNLLTVFSYRTKPGLKCVMTSFRQAWDPALDPYVRYSLRINGAIPANYNQLQAQIAPPEQDVDLPVPIFLEQLSLVEMIAYTVAGATYTGTPLITGRGIFKYWNP